MHHASCTVLQCTINIHCQPRYFVFRPFAMKRAPWYIAIPRAPCLFSCSRYCRSNRSILRIRYMTSLPIVGIQYGNTIRHTTGTCLPNSPRLRRSGPRCAMLWRSWMVCNWGGYGGRPLTYAMNGPIWSRRYFLRRYGTGIADSLCALNRCLCLIAAVSMRANEGVAYIRSFWCMWCARHKRVVCCQ